MHSGLREFCICLLLQRLWRRKDVSVVKDWGSDPSTYRSVTLVLMDLVLSSGLLDTVSMLCTDGHLHSNEINFTFIFV